MTEKEIDLIAQKVVDKLNAVAYNIDPVARVESMLRGYKSLSERDDEESKRLVHQIDVALSMIEDDDYYRALVGFYIEREKISNLAEELCCDQATVSRNKNRLLRQLCNFL